MDFKGTLSVDGEKIRRHRLARGLSLRQLARTADRSLGLICKAENGGEIRVECLRDIAEAFHVPMEELIAADTSKTKVESRKQRNVQSVLQHLRWVDDWTTGKNDVLLRELPNFVHEDAVWRYASTFPKEFHLELEGRAQIEAALLEFRGALDRQHWDLSLVQAIDADRVLAELIDYNRSSEDGLIDVAEVRYDFTFDAAGHLTMIDESTWLVDRVAELPQHVRDHRQQGQ